jgi:hypothetical protein
MEEQTAVRIAKALERIAEDLEDVTLMTGDYGQLQVRVNRETDLEGLSASLAQLRKRPRRGSKNKAMKNKNQ